LPSLAFSTLIQQRIQPMIDWIGDKRVLRNPAHITYVLNGEMKRS
jgi:hypothetical protein